MIKEIKGDLLLSGANIIGHQVNCRGVMGAGLARQIREKYPLVYDQYKNLCNAVEPQYRSTLLGKCQLIHIKFGEPNYIANIFAQNDFGSSKVQTDYKALRWALEKIKHFAKTNDLSVALPHGLGCGLANGDWNTVKDIIEEVFHDYEVSIYKLQ